ncbi:MAG TPA: hypothetical protein OIM43_05900 [Prevotellaceae bacterium]|uniref:hypothetical protein n=1 Tax=Prevotella marseillensis TaxID=2479840 RepID=UPI000F62C590|nr:hypothetical protein [Prevotella marseillensis]HJH76529.1 hypothetical protein [Prevotellaceae bacterium]
MKKYLLKSLLAVATLFLGSNAVSATNSNIAFQSTPELEMQAPLQDVPDIYIETNSTRTKDGLLIMVVRTVIRVNGTIVKDETEIIVTK